MFKDLYEKACKKSTDINEHLPILYEYASMCDHITEMGVRAGVSTTAFLYSNPKKLFCYDIYIDENVKTWFDYAQSIGKDYHYIKSDVTTIEIESTDLLFLDTVHQYKQLKTELSLHAKQVKKFIIFHDTETFGTYGQDPTVDFGFDGRIGIIYAIQEFLHNNPIWHIVYQTHNNNGLMIIKKYE